MATTMDGRGAVERPDAAGRSRLIESDRVQGTDVRRPDGSRVGTVERLLIEKRSGRVVYAAVTFGGFLGMGEGSLTLPWEVLRFNPDLDAYEVDISDERLRDTPQMGPGEPDPSGDRAWEEHVHRYFDARPYWDEAAPRATHEMRSS